MSDCVGSAHWYCVQTKVRAEEQALLNLQRQAFECFLPRIQRRLRRANVRQRRTAIEPLFPGYLFLHVDAAQQSLATVRSTLGVVDLVRFGGIPARVGDALVARLQRDGGLEGVIVPPEPTYKPGDAVSIVQGPMAGMNAIYTQGQGRMRAWVLMQWLGGEHKVCVATDSLQPAACLA